jgi:hypothetical protein
MLFTTLYVTASAGYLVRNFVRRCQVNPTNLAKHHIHRFEYDRKKINGFVVLFNSFSMKDENPIPTNLSELNKGILLSKDAKFIFYRFGYGLPKAYPTNVKVGITGEYKLLPMKERALYNTDAPIYQTSEYYNSPSGSFYYVTPFRQRINLEGRVKAIMSIVNKCYRSDPILPEIEVDSKEESEETKEERLLPPEDSHLTVTLEDAIDERYDLAGPMLLFIFSVLIYYVACEVVGEFFDDYSSEKTKEEKIRRGKKYVFEYSNPSLLLQSRGIITPIVI